MTDNPSVIVDACHLYITDRLSVSNFVIDLFYIFKFNQLLYNIIYYCKLIFYNDGIYKTVINLKDHNCMQGQDLYYMNVLG